MTTIKVLIVDDDKSVLDGLKIILELENFEVVGLCTNAKDAMDIVKQKTQTLSLWILECLLWMVLKELLI